MSEKNKPIGRAKGVLAGGVFGALGGIAIGTRYVDGIEASQSLTALALGAGFVVGALLGLLFVHLRT